jgi:hypothetical protein
MIYIIIVGIFIKLSSPTNPVEVSVTPGQSVSSLIQTIFPDKSLSELSQITLSLSRRAVKKIIAMNTEINIDDYFDFQPAGVDEELIQIDPLSIMTNSFISALVSLTSVPRSEREYLIVGSIQLANNTIATSSSTTTRRTIIDDDFVPTEPKIKTKNLTVAQVINYLCCNIKEVQSLVTECFNYDSLFQSQSEQKEIFGPFFKQVLPWQLYQSGNKPTLRLEMMGREVEGDEEFKKIFDEFSDKTRSTIQCFATLSGTGKTGTIMGLAKKMYTVYVTCANHYIGISSVSIGTDDPTFATLMSLMDVERMSIFKSPNVTKQQTDQLRDLITPIVNSFIASRMLFLPFLQSVKQDLTPEDFLRAQFHPSGNKLLVRIYEFVRNNLSPSNIANLLQTLSRDYPILVAIDEVQLLTSFPSGFKHISFSTPNPSNSVQFREGILSFFLHPLKSLFKLVIAGTSFNIKLTSHVESSVGKELGSNYTQITQFTSCKAPRLFLEKWIDLSGINIDDRTLLTLSRHRWVASIICKISQLQGEFKNKTKQEWWDAAIELAKTQITASLTARISEICKNDLAPPLLCKLVHVWTLIGKFKFWAVTDIDFLQHSLCSISTCEESKNEWIFEEEFVIEVLQGFLYQKGYEPSLLATIRSLQDQLQSHGTKSSSKGNSFEQVIHATLSDFKEKRLIDLPFIQPLLKDIPECLKPITFTFKNVILPDILVGLKQDHKDTLIQQIDNFYCAKKTTNHPTADEIQLLHYQPTQTSWHPTNFLGPDFIAILSKDPLCIFTVQIKLYTSSINVLETTKTTDIKNAYSSTRFVRNFWKQSSTFKQLESGNAWQIRVHIVLTKDKHLLHRQLSSVDMKTKSVMIFIYPDTLDLLWNDPKFLSIKKIINTLLELDVSLPQQQGKELTDDI